MLFQTIASHQVSARIAILPPKRSLTLLGIDGAELRQLMETAPDTGRKALQLDLRGGGQADRIVESVLNDLADLAMELWPDWAPSPDALPSWRRAAGKRAQSRRRPRFSRIARTSEREQLLLTVDSRGLVLLASIDPARPARAAPVIHALEWCAAGGAAVVYVCPCEPPAEAPYDRILYGALEVIRAEPEPAANRLVVSQGLAHGGSEIESRVMGAVLADRELGALFEFNRMVETTELGLKPRVDLLWREGRVVVEIDGPEHFGFAACSADRHRDYELNVAGYLVLRITNAQVATDLARAIEKIRRLVRFRKDQREKVWG